TREGDGRTVFHLITKAKCTDLPTYECLRESLKQMREWCVKNKVKSVWCVKNKVKSVSVPRLGCGLDKLDFLKVYKIVSEVFFGLDMTITIYSL
ncbi:MAG: hypothetical protein ACRC6N_01505, partial [Plesiomonas sp.]|uniref:hypothetical protein n=1 Tax=Plesiomonas sp. TaxID=2486279 RepID=UPI003F2D7C43